MFSNWKTRLPAIGGFIGFIIALLGFFGVTANEVREFMTAHSFWLIGAVASFGVFIWGVYLWWKSARVRPDNVQSKLRGWLDYYGLAHRVVPWDAWHFGYEVTHPRRPQIFVYRQKTYGDYLAFQARIVGIAQDQRAAYNGLTEQEKIRFYTELSLEVARAQITFSSEAELETVIIEKWIPITPGLAAADVLDALNEIHFSTTIIWTFVALRLGRQQLPLNPTPPSSTPDTEASPPSPT